MIRRLMSWLFIYLFYFILFFFLRLLDLKFPISISCGCPGALSSPICRQISYACIMTPLFFFTQILHPMTPFLTTVHTQWSFFFQNFNVKFQIFRALCAHFTIFVNFQLKKANFHWNLTKFTPNDPFLEKFRLKQANFGTTPNDPLFSIMGILYQMPFVFVLR